MPRGGARPNSGPKPRSLHSRSMTNARIQRPTDDPLRDNVFAMPPPAPPPQTGLDEGWQPSAADLRSLGRKGKALTMQWIDMHVMTLQEGVILLAAARCRDAADRWHARARAKGPAQARFSRLALQYERQFALLLGQLRVRP